MKKTLLVAFLLLFGFAVQAQAVVESSNQGTKPGQNSVPTQGNQDGNAVQTEEQNQLMNQGEDSQIQTQEQNTLGTGDGAKDASGKDKSGAGNSAQRKSQVAAAAQTMNQIADRNGGVGQQIRTIAQNQNQNQEKLEKNIEKIQGRSAFAKFFIGPNYGEIKDAKKTLEQNREQIRQLNQIRTQLANQGDQQMLAEQIRVLEQSNQGIETLLSDAQKGFSLFGWLSKLIS